MKNGDYSTVVESEYGYHVFKMIALTDEDATAEIKKKHLSEKVYFLGQEKEASYVYNFI